MLGLQKIRTGFPGIHKCACAHTDYKGTSCHYRIFNLLYYPREKRARISSDQTTSALNREQSKDSVIAVPLRQGN